MKICILKELSDYFKSSFNNPTENVAVNGSVTIFFSKLSNIVWISIPRYLKSSPFAGNVCTICVIIWVEVAFKMESDPLRFSERMEKICFDFMI